MNLFEKRATEYIRDPVAFLPCVTPEPLFVYLESYAKEDVLFDRLVVLIGAPGSGKTTLARLFEFPTLTTLLRMRALTNQASLVDALTHCKAIEGQREPQVCGCRLPLESDYREIWELPYDAPTRNGLLFSFVQARAVLAWIRGFEEAGLSLDQIRMIPRTDAAAALQAIGGTDLNSLRETARKIERDIYSITASLLPPPQDQLPEGAAAAYRPFDVIDAFEMPGESAPLRLKPLLICDDANMLHPDQLDELLRWLTRREIRIARWLLMRIDALRPHEVLRPDGDTQTGIPAMSSGRDMKPIWMQGSGDRLAKRRAFRKIAKDMSERYLQQMPVFTRPGLTNLADLLEEAPINFAPSKLKELEASLKTGKRAGIGPARRTEIEATVDDYLRRSEERGDMTTPPEIRLMMIRILMERYLKRIPQPSLFEETLEAVPSVPLTADSNVRNAAEMQLFHEYERPFYYGFDTLCDASSENAEKFLRLAGHLVAQLETQIIRRRRATLFPAEQDKLLRERANRLLEEEDLPERARVMRLCRAIANQCLEQTRGELNARLNEGSNAWGVPQESFDSIPDKHPELALALQSGVAYNMFTLVRDYKNQGKVWCLIELSGFWSLSVGLTLMRGGFLERDVSDLVDAIGSGP